MSEKLHLLAKVTPSWWMFASQPKQNINFMNAAENSKTAPKPLSAKAIEKLKPGAPIKADIGENAGLRVKCGSTGIKTFFLSV